VEQLIVLITFAAFTYFLNKRSGGDLLNGVGIDFKLLTTKTGREILAHGRRFLHFNLTGLICFCITALGYLINGFFYAPLFDQFVLVIASAFIGLWINLMREIYFADQYGADFDNRDIRFGFYGGLTYGLITLLLANLL
jgi:hypothetical protein